MELKTADSKNLSYAPEDIVYFPEGLFGFDTFKKFVPLPLEDDSDSLILLQSITDENVSFILMNPFYLMKDYNPILSEEDLSAIGNPKEADISYYVICVLREPIECSTVNMKCPIAVNYTTRTARQSILNQPEYTFQHVFGSFSTKEE